LLANERLIQHEIRACLEGLPHVRTRAHHCEDHRPAMGGGHSRHAGNLSGRGEIKINHQCRIVPFDRQLQRVVCRHAGLGPDLKLVQQFC
jgi:hypothetical protein